MATPRHLPLRAVGFATLAVISECLGFAVGWMLGSIFATWTVGFATGFAGACSAPFVAAVVSRRVLEVPRKPVLAVTWIAAGCAVAFGASMLTGRQGQREVWMGLSVYTSLAAVFLSSLTFGLVEHRLD
jgi:hypothetical protein